MRFRAVLCAILVLVAIVHEVRSQGDRLWREIHFHDSTIASAPMLWSSIDYNVSSNRMSNELMQSILFEGAVGPQAIEGLLAQPPTSRTRVAAGTEGAFWFKSRGPEGWSMVAGTGFSDMVFGHMQTSMVQLYLNGNAQFEGERVALGPGKLKYFSNQFIGFGVERSYKRGVFGVSAILVKTSRFQEVNLRNASIFTAQNGTSVEASADFEYVRSSTMQSIPAAWYGTGAGVNLYWTYQPDSGGAVFSVQATDIGFVRFSGARKYEMNKDTVFGGVQVNSILELSNAFSGEIQADSLEALLGMNVVDGQHSAWLPARVQLDFVKPMSERWSLAMQLRQFMSYGVPQCRTGVHWQVTHFLGVEPYVRFGGFTRFDSGVTITSRFRDRIRLMFGYEMFGAHFNPQNTSSQALYFAGQWRF